jgi:uncharacterized protein YcbK (DUF882 family)
MFNHGLERWMFACKCKCGFDTVDAELLEVLEDLELYFGVKITELYGCRCRQHNESIKERLPSYIPWSSNSQHLYGKAGDIKLDGISPKMVYEYLDKKYPNKYGMSKYETFVHIDVRSKKARW